MIANPNPYGEKLFGKYRGMVKNTCDSTQSGKIEVTIKNIYDGGVWARPCVPYASTQSHGMFFMPPKDTLVWVEFEAGDRTKPIWTGFAWPKGKAPAASADEMVIATPSGTIRFSASDKNEIIIETKDHSIVVSDNAVTIKASTNTSIVLDGTSTKINGENLEIL